MNGLEKKFDKKAFQTTYLTQGKTEMYGQRYKDVIDSVMHKLNRWSGARRTLEEDWEECWAHYLSNYRGNQIIERYTTITVGDVDNEYRHKITTSKGYEIIETANAYLQGAFFPSKVWFNLVPKMPIDSEGWEEDILVMNRYVLNKVEEAGIRNAWDRFCRQALIVGTSVMALPWLYDTRESYKKEKNRKSGKWEPVPITKITHNGLKLEVLDMFDVYLDPGKACASDSDLIRRVLMTKGEVLRMVDEGLYPLADRTEVTRIPQYSRAGSVSETYKENLKWAVGLGTGDYRNEEEIALYEYWGDLVIGDCEYLDVHAVFSDDVLFVFEPNPFWGGKPFVIGSLVDGHESPYGIGLLEPIKGLLHQLYIGQNHRLDCDDFLVDPMFLVRSDGSVDIDDVFARPGKIIQVEDPDTDIKQVELNGSNVSIQVQDEQILETRINQATGVGDYINNQGRDAERVTAAEVQARQNAGGNRLGRFHKHLEDTALKDFLALAYAYLQQFVETPEVVRIQKPDKLGMGDNYEYYSVDTSDLQMEMELVPVGADHVIDRETELRERVDFYTFIQNLPQAAQFINWKEVVKDLARRLIKDDWAKYVILPEEQNGIPVDPGTGQSQAELLSKVQQPPQAPPQGEPPIPQVPPQEEAGGSPPGFDQQQLEAMMAQNPEMAQKVVGSNVQANQQLGQGL